MMFRRTLTAIACTALIGFGAAGFAAPANGYDAGASVVLEGEKSGTPSIVEPMSGDDTYTVDCSTPVVTGLSIQRDDTIYFPNPSPGCGTNFSVWFSWDDTVVLADDTTLMADIHASTSFNGSVWSDVSTNVNGANIVGFITRDGVLVPNPAPFNLTSAYNEIAYRGAASSGTIIVTFAERSDTAPFFPSSLGNTQVFVFTLGGGGTPAPDPTPAPANPPSAPAAPELTPGDGEVTVSWETPATQGSFPVTHYQVQSVPSGAGCLVPATQTQCTIGSLTNGTTYEFMVRALNGGGWGPWLDAGSVTPVTPIEASIMITGSRGDVRGKSGVVVQGSTTGLDAGSTLHPWIRLPRQDASSEGMARITIGSSGEFTWQRRTGRGVEQIDVKICTSDALVCSDSLTIQSDEAMPSQ